MNITVMIKMYNKQYTNINHLADENISCDKGIYCWSTDSLIDQLAIVCITD